MQRDSFVNLCVMELVHEQLMPHADKTTRSLVMESAVELKAWMEEATMVRVEILTVDVYNEVWQRAQI
jgi:hypothetical protein